MRFATLLIVVAALTLQAQEVSHSTAPILTHKVDPVYTSEAIAAKLQGTVVLSAIVGTDGIPSDIRVLRELGKGLDENAVECLKVWRFKPATKFSEPVSAKVTVEIEFRLPRSDTK